MTVPMADEGFLNGVLSSDDIAADSSATNAADAAAGYDAVPEKAFEEEEENEKDKVDSDTEEEAAANNEHVYRSLRLTPKLTAATTSAQQAVPFDGVEMAEMGQSGIAVMNRVYDRPVTDPATRPAQTIQQTARGLDATVNAPANQQQASDLAAEVRAKNGWTKKRVVTIASVGVAIASLDAAGVLLGSFLLNDQDDPQPAPEPAAVGDVRVCGFLPGTDLKSYIEQNVAVWRAMDEGKVWCVLRAWATATDADGTPVPDVIAPSVETQVPTLVALAFLAGAAKPDGRGLPDDQAPPGDGWRDAWEHAKDHAFIQRPDSALDGKPLQWSKETDTKTLLDLYRDAESLHIASDGGDAKPLHRAFKLVLLAQAFKPFDPNDPAPDEGPTG